MFDKASHAQNILETGIATVTSSGHWFNLTRDTINEAIPGLLQHRSFEDIVKEAVAWVESPDNLTLVLYFGLVFLIDTMTVLFLTLLFYFFWYTFKHFFIRRPVTPLLKFLSLDMLQAVVAAVALSFLGIGENYTGLVIGIIYFFLFKVGLMRMALNWLNRRRTTDVLPLNDKLFCSLLHRYSRSRHFSTVPLRQLESRVWQRLSERKK